MELDGQDPSQDRISGHISLVGLKRRRSSLFNPKEPLQPSVTWKVHGDHSWSVLHTDGSETTLAYKKQGIVSVKNFNLELRGLLDIESLIGETIVILNPNTSSIRDLVDEALDAIIKSQKNLEERSFKEEVVEGIFTDLEGQIFTHTLQGFNTRLCDSSAFESSWICSFCNSSQLKKRFVVITRLKEPTNFGQSSEEVKFFILILCPTKDKGTKSHLETARTFGTLFSDCHLRQTLTFIHNEEVFKNTLAEWAKKIANVPIEATSGISSTKHENVSENWRPFVGIKNDVIRRLKHYVSDYTDGIQDARSIQKTVSTSAFLYFACLLPTIAFGTLNDNTTGGEIDVRKGIFAQAIGHGAFSLFGGQHLNILLTTAPLCLFVKIIHGLAEYFDIVDQFAAFYCCVGLWCSLFLFLSAVFNLSKIMKWCTRSTEEIFALFISVAFVVYAAKDVSHDFQHNYNAISCVSTVDIVLHNDTNPMTLSTNGYRTNGLIGMCHRDTSLLFLLLMLGTAWFGLALYNFKDTPYLKSSTRELLSDYSLPAAVILFSFIGSFVFRDIPVDTFEYNDSKPLLQLAQVQNLPVVVILCSAILGFSLSVLIFMDQNIGAAIVNNPANKLTKGPAYHWDLVIISVINIFCSLFTLPWLHVALPHAPMHVKNLADFEERVENGVINQSVVKVRETRLTGIISHILMGLSLLLLPYPLKYIPISVFDGLYLYMGITALGGNQLFERILLLFTEQRAYPPNHYIRRVPQRKIHQFTAIQVLQLLLLCVLGFFPYPFVKVVFPLVLLLLLFVRHQVLPHLIEKKYLEVLD